MPAVVHRACPRRRSQQQSRVWRRRKRVSFSVIGKPVGRVEGPDKVSGAARYAADQLPPGVIWGKAHRSALPHARILRIDTAKARAYPGVLAVLTAADLPDVLVGRLMFHLPVLAPERARFIGYDVTRL